MLQLPENNDFNGQPIRNVPGNEYGPNPDGYYEPYPTLVGGSGGGTFIPPVKPNPTFVPPSYAADGKIKIILSAQEDVQFTENDVNIGIGKSISIEKTNIAFGSQKIYKAVKNGAKAANYYIVSIQKTFNTIRDIENNADLLTSGLPKISTNTLPPVLNTRGILPVLSSVARNVNTSNNTTALADDNLIFGHNMGNPVGLNDYLYAESISVKEYQYNPSQNSYTFLSEKQINKNIGIVDLQFNISEVDLETPNVTVDYEIQFTSNYKSDLGNVLSLQYEIISKEGLRIDGETFSLQKTGTDGKKSDTNTLKNASVNIKILGNLPAGYTYKNIYYKNASSDATYISEDSTKGWKEVDEFFTISGNELKGGIIVNAILERNIVVPKPQLNLSNTQYDKQVKDSDKDSKLNIVFNDSNADFVDVYIPNKETFRIKASQGYIPLSFVNDFNKVFGKTKIILVPFSDEYGSGDRYEVLINFIPVNDFPSITQIIFPTEVEIPSFSDGNVEWDIEYSTKAVSSVDVDLYLKDKTRVNLFKNLPQKSSFKINLRDLATKFPLWNGSDVLSLVFKPYNRSGETELVGNEYEISTNILYPTIKLDEDIIRKSIYDAFVETLKFNEPEKESKYLTHLLNLGNDDRIIISSWEEDNWTLSEKGEDDFGNTIVKNEVKSIILKLYEPLPPEVQINSTMWITKLMTNPLIETVVLNEEAVSDYPYIKGPNFDIEVDFVKGQSTNYESIDDLIISSSSSSTLIQNYLSSSLVDTSELNIKYASGSITNNTANYLWSNFVHFSSAVERINNFVYKVKLIENYENLIVSASVGAQTSSLAGQQEVQRLNTKKSSLIQGFDGFETFLYTLNSTYTTDTSHSITWPGEVNNQLLNLSVSNIYDDNPVQIDLSVPVNKNILKSGDQIYIQSVSGMADLNNRYYYVDVTPGGQNILLYEDPEFGINISSSGSYSGAASVYKVTSNYNRLKSTNQQVIKWYERILGLATVYDNNNPNWLINNIPQYITTNPENDNYLLFFSMIGHHFDNIYYYTKAIERSRGLGYESNNGVANKVLYEMLKSFSWDAKNIGGDKELWNYVFGEDKIGNTSESTPSNIRSKEVWRRIINNLPYLLKHKGTRRGIYALMTCYGIPSSNLSIMEFGGPEVTDDTKNKLLMDATSYALKMEPNQTIPIGVYNDTKTIELFIKPAMAGNYNVVSDGTTNIVVSGSIGSTYGKVKFGAIETPLLPLFNGRYFGIALSEYPTYTELNVMQVESDRLIFSASVTGSTPSISTTITLGSSNFSGSVDEFRIWNTPLSRSVFEQHVYYPEMVNGNHLSSSTTDLDIRFDFEYPKNLGTKNKILNVAPIINLGSNSRNYYEDNNTTLGITGRPSLKASTSTGFSTIKNHPYHFEIINRNVVLEMPDIGTSRYATNKVRFEEQALMSDLSSKSRSTKKAFDNQPIDSNRVGLFFSPNKELNLDIAKAFGDSNFNEYIGDPSDRFKSGYKSLDNIRNYYFQRINGRDIYSYINLIRAYEKAMFEDIKKMLPARVTATTGILVEPHFLERSKYQYTKPTGSSDYHEGTITPTNTQYAEYEQYDAIVNADMGEEVFGENAQYESIVDADFGEKLFAENNQYDATIYANNEIGTIGEYFSYEANIEYELATGTLTKQDINEDNNKLVGRNDYQDIGFSIYAQNGYAIRNYYDSNGILTKERVRVNMVEEQKTKTIIRPSARITIGSNRYSDLRSEPIEENITYTETKLVIQPFSGSTAPAVGGGITSVKAVDGYLPTHYRYTTDLTTGMQNAYFRGCKNTAATTLDGTPPVEVFVTNPNVIKVAGRDNNEPILDVE